MTNFLKFPKLGQIRPVVHVVLDRRLEKGVKDSK